MSLNEEGTLMRFGGNQQNYWDVAGGDAVHIAGNAGCSLSAQQSSHFAANYSGGGRKKTGKKKRRNKKTTKRKKKLQRK